MKKMVPIHVWQLMQPYGLQPEPGELPAAPAPSTKRI
jgi:hypothetical protein